MNAETKLAPEHEPTQLAGHGGTPLGGTGVVSPASVRANLTAPQLIAHAIRRNEGRLSADGALIGRTGVHTGRSVADKFVVDEPEPDYVILHAPEFQADPRIAGCASTTVIALSFAKRKIVIAGTEYAGRSRNPSSRS